MDFTHGSRDLLQIRSQRLFGCVHVDLCVCVCVYCHRNLTVMRRQTATLGHEAAEMEDKLQLLKNRMSQEKEERR